MPDFIGIPTEEIIDRARAYYEDVWRNTHKRITIVDSFYQREYGLWTKEQMASRASYRPSTPTNIIEHAADNIVGFSMRVHRDPIGSADSAKDEADELEKQLLWVVQHTARREMQPPWKLAAKYLAGYGYTVIEGPLWGHHGEPVLEKRLKSESDDEWAAQERRFKAAKKNWNPIRMRVPHPASVLMDPTEKQPTAAIKIEQMHAQRLHDRSVEKKGRRVAGKVFEMAGRSPLELIDIEHWWTTEHHAVKVKDGGILWIDKNIWGFVPFIHAFSGYGMRPMDDQHDPQYAAEGVIWPVQDSIKVEAQSASAKQTLLMDAAYASKGTTKDPAQAAAAENRGGYLQGEKSDYWTQETNQMTSWMFRIGEEVSDDIIQGSINRSLSGSREAGVTTVGQQALLSTDSRRRLASPSVQLEELATIFSQRVLQLVDVLNEPIRGLRPSLIHNNYDVSTSFEVIDPVLQLHEREVGLREVAQGVKSERTYRESDLRMENETQEEDRLRVEKLEKVPEIQSALLRLKAKELGIEQAYDDAIQRAGGDIGLLQEISGTASPEQGFVRQGLSPAVAKPRRADIA
jgi:hypothetical protein